MTLKERIHALVKEVNPVGYDQWQLLLGQAEYKEVLAQSSKHRKGTADKDNICWILDLRKAIPLAGGRTQIGMMLGLRVIITRDPQLLELKPIEHVGTHGRH